MNDDDQEAPSPPPPDLEPPGWGAPPDADELSALIKERYPLRKGERSRAWVDLETRSVAVTLDAGRHHYRIAVTYRRGAGRQRDPWLLMVDAVDALYGTFVENERTYRELPFGEDVEFDGAFFKVDVEHSVPELSKIADQLLEEKGPKA